MDTADREGTAPRVEREAETRGQGGKRTPPAAKGENHKAKKSTNNKENTPRKKKKKRKKTTTTAKRHAFSGSNAESKEPAQNYRQKQRSINNDKGRPS